MLLLLRANNVHIKEMRRWEESEQHLVVDSEGQYGSKQEERLQERRVGWS